MVRHHPQWRRAGDRAARGPSARRARSRPSSPISLPDPDNIRNRADMGGGGLYDIGCYAILTARYIFGAEPERVIGADRRDPEIGHRPRDERAAEFPAVGT